MDNKVEVISNSTGIVILNVPSLNLRREFLRKGAKMKFDRDQLIEACYDIGVENLFKTGVLYTEDMAFKKEIGLEPEDATEPVNIIVLDDKQKKRLLTVMPYIEFKNYLNDLPEATLEDLVEYAVANKIQDYQKVQALKEKTGKDISKMIALSDDVNEKKAK